MVLQQIMELGETLNFPSSEGIALLWPYAQASLQGDRKGLGLSSSPTYGRVTLWSDPSYEYVYVLWCKYKCTILKWNHHFHCLASILLLAHMLSFEATKDLNKPTIPASLWKLVHFPGELLNPHFHHHSEWLSHSAPISCDRNMPIVKPAFPTVVKLPLAKRYCLCLIKLILF